METQEIQLTNLTDLENLTVQQLQDLLKVVKQREKDAEKTSAREQLIGQLKVNEFTVVPYRLYSALRLDVVVTGEYDATTKTIPITFNTEDDLNFYKECLRHLRGYKF